MDDIIFKSTLESFDKDVLKSDIPVAVLFYTENCPACDSFVPIFERTAERYSKHIKFVKIYRQQNRQLAESLRVKSSPTVLFYKEGNEVCDRLNGYISKPEFTGSIEKVVGNVCKKAKREKVYCDFLIMGGGLRGCLQQFMRLGQSFIQWLWMKDLLEDRWLQPSMSQITPAPTVL